MADFGSSIRGLRDYLKQIDVWLFLLVVLFATSSWIDVNGVWVELPMLVQKLPESWNLASYLVIIIQIANIGPLAYGLAKTLAPNKVTEWPIIILIISIGIASSVLLIFFWDRTSYWAIFDGQHSTGLLVLSFFMSLVDCTSSVLYFPYMSNFSSAYMIALFVGEGLSGLIPALVGLVQLTDDENSKERFGVSIFFLIIAILLSTSLVSFLLIHFFPRFKEIRLQKQRNDIDRQRDSFAEPNVEQVSAACANMTFQCASTRGIEPKPEQSVSGDVALINDITENDDEVFLTEPPQNESLYYVKAIALLGITAWLSALVNGFLPALQTYSAQPYGKTAYNLHVKLSVLVNPIACFLTLFIHVRRFSIVAILALLGTVLAAYQVVLATLSPHPPLQYDIAGIVALILTQVAMTAIFSFTKVSIANIMSTFKGKNWLLFFGALTQIGSLTGAIIAFLLVNVFKIFKSGY